MYEANSLVIRHRLELGKGNTYLAEIREHWEVAIKKAFEDIPAISWFPEDQGGQCPPYWYDTTKIVQ